MVNSSALVSSQVASTSRSIPTLDHFVFRLGSQSTPACGFPDPATPENRSISASSFSTPPQPMSTSTTISVDSLSQPLPFKSMIGLTRSSRLFSVLTQMDARSLSIAGNDEYYLFMDMRLELRWLSYEMTAIKWTRATNDFNTRLATLNSSKGIIRTVKKHPRALQDKLSEVEKQISGRIKRQDFVCKSPHSTSAFLLIVQ